MATDISLLLRFFKTQQIPEFESKVDIPELIRLYKDLGRKTSASIDWLPYTGGR